MASMDERYHVLTLAYNQSGVYWNGHFWPRDYTCEVIGEKPHVQFSKQEVHLSCGHWTHVMSRFALIAGVP